MTSLLRPSRIRSLAGLALALTALTSCSDQAADVLTAPGGGANQNLRRQSVEAALQAQARFMPTLMQMEGVVGTAVGKLPNGRIGVRIFTEFSGVPGLPGDLDGVETGVEVIGRIMALSDPTSKARPAPLGFSIGHPDITAGSIGGRVVNGVGDLFVLSNNHVLANSNGASLGDAAYQPGPFDGGTSADQVATLAAFYPIVFSSNASNTMDAAIAATDASQVSNASPADDGYGAPSTEVFGDANHDGLFDNKGDLLGLAVQKYGRTTGLTQGTITGINGTLSVCYEVVWIFCTKSARFVDQIIIDSPGFSGGGDSGSLIVTNDGLLNPVALLFAGSANQTIANRIDLVLKEFDVAFDGGGPPPPPPPPPDPLTDIEIVSVSTPGSVTVGDNVNASVTVRNSGNQAVAASFDVVLQDQTDAVQIGSQVVNGLAAGASTILSFPWSTLGASIGSHTLRASHNFPDEDSSNDAAQRVMQVSAPSVAIHVGDLSSEAAWNDQRTWYAIVEVTVHDANHNPINGVTVVGSWSRSGLASDTCTTGELGGNGSCIFLFPSLRKNYRSVDFTVSSATANGYNYTPGANHDVNGGSNGTTIRVNRPN